MSGVRVVWDCGTEECGQCCTGTHYGQTVDIPHARAVDLGLTADPPNEVAVTFDDRPGVIQFHAWSELTVLEDAPTTCWLCGQSHLHGPWHVDGCPHCGLRCVNGEANQ